MVLLRNVRFSPLRACHTAPRGFSNVQFSTRTPDMIDGSGGVSSSL